MGNTSTYEGLEQKVKELEKEVDERKETEDALQESEERYRDLYEKAPSGYLTISAFDGSILRRNAAAPQLLGYDRETMMGMKVFDLYADTPHGEFKAKEVFKRYKAGGSIRDVEL
jgi:PAS domain S-box-containing protein